MTKRTAKVTPEAVANWAEWNAWYVTTPRSDRHLVFPPFSGLQAAFLQADGRRLDGTATRQDLSWLTRSGWGEATR